MYLGFLFAVGILTLGVLSVYVVINGSTVVSPLPVALGEKLQLNQAGRDEQELAQLLKKQGITYIGIKPMQSEYIIQMSEKQQVIVSKNKNITDQISSLQVIIPRLTMEGREFRKLDLRFDKPVVTY